MPRHLLFLFISGHEFSQEKKYTLTLNKNDKLIDLSSRIMP